MVEDALRPVVRWTVARKAAVLEALSRGSVTRRQVLDAHGMDEEELRAWEDGMRKDGMAALHALPTSKGRRAVLA